MTPFNIITSFAFNLFRTHATVMPHFTSDRPIALDLQNIHKSYGSLEVLKGVSLTAYDGDVISILGSSGSGKSTLLRCINLLEHPNQGTITLGGTW